MREPVAAASFACASSGKPARVERRVREQRRPARTRRARWGRCGERTGVAAARNVSSSTRHVRPREVRVRLERHPQAHGRRRVARARHRRALRSFCVELLHGGALRHGEWEEVSVEYTRSLPRPPLPRFCAGALGRSSTAAGGANRHGSPRYPRAQVPQEVRRWCGDRRASLEVARSRSQQTARAPPPRSRQLGDDLPRHRFAP